MERYYTPLRYPGGKAKLANYFKLIFRENNLCDGHYVEPYAGGAGIAIELLATRHAAHIHLNDLNIPIYSFWYCVLNYTDKLCHRISTCKITMNNWKRQKKIVESYEKYDIFEVGFACFYLNRTNRSGILSAGVIGGKNQTGKWKIDARFNREPLVTRIRRIASFKKSISLYNLDAAILIKSVIPVLPTSSLIYIDPPYYKKGQHLYDNHYLHHDHETIAELVQSNIKHPWIMSYDNCDEISRLYRNRRQESYYLNYHAQNYSKGSELMIYSDDLTIPEVINNEIRLTS